MKQTTFQHPELRDANDNIIQQGAFGKNTALANSTNDGWIDYVANDLEALYNNTMGGTGGEINTETITGKTGTITTLTATTVKAGTVQYVDNGKVFAIGHAGAGNVDLGWNWVNREGAVLALRSTDYASPGEFTLFARDANNTCSLTGKPDGTLTWDEQPLLPVGIVQAFAGTTIPNGWLLCDGSVVSRTDYAKLYAVIGTTYGKGNGSTTFNLPNLVDKFVEGSATAGTVKSAGLPNITGSFGGGAGAGGPAGNGSGIGFLRDTMINGCFQPSANAYGNESGSGGGTLPSGYPVLTANLNASRSSAIYGNSTTVQPPALTMRYIIKY